MVVYADNITIEIQLIFNSICLISKLQDASVVVFSKYSITQYRICRFFQVDIIVEWGIVNYLSRNDDEMILNTLLLDLVFSLKSIPAKRSFKATLS